MSKKDLINMLNQDLSAELGTIIRYNYQASKASGPEAPSMREMLRGEIPDELGHATFLSDVIVDLGGEPTLKPKEFKPTENLKDMLEQDLKLELQDVVNYKQHAQAAEALGEVELKLKLEEMAADESEHARELARVLRGI
ncbi:MAG: ferritin-like domain-containing protein [Anaerolineales bacterium]